MRGRRLFNAVYPILKFLSLIFYVLPKFILTYLWILSDLLPNMIALGVRYSIAKRLMANVGKNVFFGKNIEVIGWQHIEIGNDVSIHKNCYIDGSGGLLVGNDVSIAHNSSILTFEHSWNEHHLPIKSNPLTYDRVIIKDDVWIGCGVRLLSGVTVNSRSIIAAGAVVINEVGSNQIVAGVPAKLIKKI